MKSRNCTDEPISGCEWKHRPREQTCDDEEREGEQIEREAWTHGRRHV